QEPRDGLLVGGAVRAADQLGADVAELEVEVLARIGVARAEDLEARFDEARTIEVEAVDAHRVDAGGLERRAAELGRVHRVDLAGDALAGADVEGPGPLRELGVVTASEEELVEAPPFDELSVREVRQEGGERGVGPVVLRERDHLAQDDARPEGDGIAVEVEEPPGAVGEIPG